MIMLSLTTDKLQLVTDAAVTVDVHCSYDDYTTAAARPDKQNTAISTATTTDILAAPGASTTRKLKYMAARNKHASSSVNVTIVFDANGTDYELHKTNLLAGECLEYIEGVGFFQLQASPNTDLWKALTSDDAGGQNVNTAQPWFPTGGAVTVIAGTVYEFYGRLHLSRAAGTTSHTTGVGMGGTATITDYGATYWCGEGEVATLADDDSIVAESVANLQVKAASTTATEQVKLAVMGIVIINAAGTFIPQFTYSAAPGGAPTVRAGSFFHMTKFSPNPQGPWA